MTKTILQSVEFSASPETLFDIYLDSKRHSEAINAPVSVSREPGGEFRTFDDGLKGRNLAIVPNRMIVQSWRASTWKKDDPDSILILLFDKVTNGARVRFSGKKRIVTDGPFAETKELIAGFWLWQVKSKEEAIEWVKRCPNPHGEESEIEIRQVFEAEDFGDAFTPELRKKEKEIRTAVEARRR